MTKRTYISTTALLTPATGSSHDPKVVVLSEQATFSLELELET